jgi:hypothetical protein
MFKQLPHALRSLLISQSLLYRLLGFIVLGIVSRLIPHPPNFTAMNAIALFGITSLGCFNASLFAVFASMWIGDLILFGLHSTLLFVYFSLGLTVLMGFWLKQNKSLANTLKLSILSSLLFFVITNFGVWLTCSIYPATPSGLMLCYVAALPFLANNLIATILYGQLISFFFFTTEITENTNRSFFYFYR